MNAVLQVLALLARVVTACVAAVGRRKAQERFDRIERDPAAEFLRRFRRTEDAGSPSPSDPGKRDT